MPDPYYPDRSHFKTHEEWDAHVQTLNVVYEQKAKLEKAIEDLKKVAKVAQSNVGQTTGGPLNTTIVGLAVTPGQPANGDTLRFDSKSGQFKFGV
jgi:hypothetical protein